MSQITQLSVYSHCNNLGGKIWNPAIRWTSKYAVFVVLKDDEGVCGLGECWCFDSAPDALVAYLRTEIAPQVIGLDIAHYESLVNDLTRRATLTARHGMLASAISGVDIAIWDLRSVHAQRPLWSFINSAGNGQVLLYASGGLYGQDKDANVLATEMCEMADAGFSIVKMKVGGLELSDDIKRVKAVIDALSADTQLIIDGVYSYDFDQALTLYEALPKARIEAFQAPIVAKDIQGMAKLNEYGVPVMASEAEYREEIHEQMVACSAVRYLQSAPIACGGLNGMKALSDLVADTKIQLSLEVSSTAVATLAACHYAAADSQVAHVEFHHVHQVFFEELELTFIPNSNGQFTLPTMPGLGMSLPLDKVVEEFSLDRLTI